MATTRFIDIKVRSSGAKKDVDKLDKSVVGLGNSVKQTNSSLGKMSKVAQAIGASLLATKITAYADGFTSVQNQIRQTVTTTDELAASTTALFDVANRARSGISETTELYTQLTLSTENLNLSTEDTLRLTETISKSFAVSGKSAAESAGAIRQLGQAFSAGALRGDEFNSIAEGAPEIMRALQRSLSMTQGELRAFAATGGITAEVLVTALSGAADVIDKKLSDSVQTFAQSMTEANNNMIEFVGGSEDVQSAISAAGGVLVTVSKNLETVSQIAIVLASVYAARLIPAVVTYTTATVVNTAASLAQEKAHIKVSAGATISAGAMARATIATRALTVASRGLTGTLAILGGPLGVILIAATAFLTFYDATSEADKGLKDFGKTVSAMDRTQQLKEGLKITFEITEVGRALDEAKAKLAEFDAVNNGSDRLGGIQAAVEKWQGKVESLSQSLTELNQKKDLLNATGDLSQGLFDEPEVVKPKADAPEVKLSASAETGFNNYKKSLERETKSLKEELKIRREVLKGWIHIYAEDEVISYETSKLARQNQFDDQIANINESETKKAELRMLFDARELELKKEHEANLTEIQKAATEDRNDIEASSRGEAITKTIDAASGLATALLKNQISSDAKTEKQKKSARKKGVYIDAAAAMIKNFATASNFYEALGQNALVAGAALTSISNINTATSLTDSGTSSSASTPAVTQDFSTNTITENTALTALTTELTNRDPDEMLPVSWVQRLVASIEEVQTSGQG